MGMRDTLLTIIQITNATEKNVPELFPISLQDKLGCLRREVKMREQVYPRWVGRGKMTQQEADRELKITKAICDDYRIKVEMHKP